MCLSHRLAPYLRLLEQGQPLWSASSGALLKRLRAQVFSLLGPELAQRISLKSFRAGYATEMAQKGLGIEAILTAGDWKSSAVLNYVRRSDLDELALLRQAWAEDSDDEASSAVGRRRWGSDG